MATSGPINLEIRQSRTFRAVLRCSGLTLTGCTFQMQLRTDYADVAPTVIHELSTENGGATVIAPDRVELYIDEADTALLPLGMKGRFDLKVTLPNDDEDVYTLMDGKFRVIPAVTR